MDELVENYKELDDEFYDDLSDILIMADVGMPTTELAVNRLKEKCKAEKIGDSVKAREALKDILVDILQADSMKLVSPMVLLVIGVNGVGKTTSIAKMAHLLKKQGKSVALAAADTFRAAAIDQLEIWAERVGVPLIKHTEGSDPAAVVFDAANYAKSHGIDVLIVDTAGRLHIKKNLMDELAKIGRVLDRELPGCARENLLVLDAVTGQNAINQAKEFTHAADITGIILTKLDGTAKGGVIISVKSELGIPVKFIGVGEQMDDLQPFDRSQFVNALFNETETGETAE